MNTISIPGFTDPFSSISHLLAALFFFIYSYKLFSHASSRPRSWLIAVVVFVISVVFLLTMSGVFHLLDHDSTGRAVLQRLDHAGIFALIAGTYTPVHTILFKGFWRWGFLFCVWLLAIVGITFKSIFFNDMAEWIGLMLYLGLGWLAIFSGYLTHRLHGFIIIKPLIYGGLAYTIGASLEFSQLPIVIAGVVGPHELFHIAVLAGIAWHWQFINNLLKLKRS